MGDIRWKKCNRLNYSLEKMYACNTVPLKDTNKLHPYWYIVDVLS